jgi:hypothetical protein
MRRLGLTSVFIVGLCSIWRVVPVAQQPPAAPLVEVTPIDPRGVRLAAEAASAGETRFSFVAYGDTRGQADGVELQFEHGRVVDAMVGVIRSRAVGSFPVRFILQSGDGVTAGSNAAQWNVSYTPLIERLLRQGGVPYFLAVGNHDVTNRPIDDPQRQPGLRNTLALMSGIYPPGGSPRRLDGYPTFGFGYGNVFVIAFDSNIASDPTQLAWVTRQLESLDRARYRHVIAVFHHPVLSSGPHGGPIVEASTEAIRRLYLPLFRTHHVRMTIAGHDHLLDHWVERYVVGGNAYRLDHLVTGGGGAPSYVFNGEPDLTEYVAAASAQKVAVEHLVRPGATIEDNPHHFVVVQVDGDRLSLEVFGTGGTVFLPYGGSQRVDLSDRRN